MCRTSYTNNGTFIISPGAAGSDWNEQHSRATANSVCTLKLSVADTSLVYTNLNRTPVINKSKGRRLRLAYQGNKDTCQVAQMNTT